MNIYDLIQKASPKKIFEIGVGNPWISRCLPFRGSGVQCELFEPNPHIYNQLVGVFGSFSNFLIRNIALFDQVGEIIFCLDGDSSYVYGQSSPTTCNASSEYIDSREKIIVKSDLLSSYDNGDVDVFLIDTEGSEWKIIKNMVSSPTLISLEVENGKYRTSDCDKIYEFLFGRGYVSIHKDSCGDEYFWLESKIDLL